VVISKTGTVDTVTLLSGDPRLAPPAVEAVKQWQYKPFLVDDRPASVKTEVDVRFSMGGNAPVDHPASSHFFESTAKDKTKLVFRDEDMAKRVAKALVHAVELCGGGKDKEEKEPF